VNGKMEKGKIESRLILDKFSPWGDAQRAEGGNTDTIKQLNN